MHSAGRPSALEAGLLLVWVIHVLLFVVLAPPWQHYDEPTHMEYALLIRELGRIPAHDEDLAPLRRAIAGSMIEAGFFEHPQTHIPTPDLDDPRLSIGFNERSHPPLYYLLVAGAISPFAHEPLEAQLRAARLVGAALAALLFYSAILLLMRLGLAPDLRLAVLAVVALHPGLADTMSSVNNDSLANLAAVWVLLGSVSFVRRPGWRWLLLSVGVMALGLYVKRTLVVYLLLIPTAWALALPRRYRRAVGFSAILLCIASMGIVGTLPSRLAVWTRVSGQDTQSSPIPVRQAGGGYMGAAAFQLERPADGPGGMLEQEIDPFLRAQASGRIVTLAGWMRADRPGLLAFTPAIQYNKTVVQDSVYLGTEWKYVTTAASLPVTTTYLAVRLSGPLAPGTVFYDSLSLIESYAPGDDYVPDGIMEEALVPAGTPKNMLRNAGAEQEIPVIPPALRRMTGRFIDPAGLERALEKTWSPQWIAAVYPRQSIALFQGFWGVFGWGEISVPARWFSSLGLLVILGLLGNIRYAWDLAASPAASRELLARRAWALCLAGVILGWGMALARVHLQPIPGAFVWSFGRYAFVALVPSLVLLIVGLAALLPRPLRQQGLIGVVGFLLVFALSAWLATLLPYWNTFTAQS